MVLLVVRANAWAHRVSRLVIAVLGAVILSVALAAPASAHATLLFADPGIDAAVPASPATITLAFNESVSIASDPVQVSDSTGSVPRLGPPRVTNDGRVVALPVLTQLAKGAYTVRWQAVSDDGDTIGGTYRFAVGVTASGLVSGSGATSTTPGLAATTTLRWLLFFALAASLGGLVGARLARPRTPAGLTAARPPVGLAAGVGLIAATGLALLVVGQGSLWRGATDPSLPALIEGRAGRAALTEMAAFAAAGSLAIAGKARWAGVPLSAVILAEGLRAHAATAAPGWGALLTATHLLAASIWVGALAFVLFLMASWHRQGGGAPARALLAAYARLAAWLFAIVAVTGTLSALVLVPWSSWANTPYGRVLLVKLALVGVITMLALAARRRLAARVAGEARRPRLGRLVGAETGVLALVVSLTAFLVSLPTPRALGGSALPVPPPPVGLSVPIGARAGAVGVSAAASEGQLVVRLSAPRVGNTAVDRTDTNRYHLAGSLTTASDPDQKLTWLSCGSGCFVTAVRWAGGANKVELRVQAEGWPGGQVQLTLPWPARPGDAELRSVVAALRKLDSIVIYERVTSDTSAGPVKAVRLRRTAAEFLESELYGSGVASQAVVVGRTTDGRTILRVGFPAELAQAELVLDGRYRIVRETLTAPNHLITRTFGYPRGTR